MSLTQSFNTHSGKLPQVTRSLQMPSDLLGPLGPQQFTFFQDASAPKEAAKIKKMLDGFKVPPAGEDRLSNQSQDHVFGV